MMFFFLQLYFGIGVGFFLSSLSRYEAVPDLKWRGPLTLMIPIVLIICLFAWPLVIYEAIKDYK